MTRLLALPALLLAAPVVAQTPPKPAPRPSKGLVTGAFGLPARPVWAGEVFDLRFAWRVDWDMFRYLDGDLTWTPDPLVMENWARAPQAPPAPAAGHSMADVAFTSRAMALQPGAIRLKPAQQQMQIVIGGYDVDGVHIANIGAVDALGTGATLVVRPLPPAPAGFSGAVGDFALHSMLEKARGAVGKPLVWKLTLSGTGNWTGFPGVPSRPLPQDFDMIGAPKLAGDDASSLFERSIDERITIVPRRPGHYTLGPVEMTIFDPAKGAYRTIASPVVALDVTGAAAAPTQPPAYEAEPGRADAGAALPPPLAGRGDAWMPLSRWAWRLGLALPAVLLVLFWLGLAFARARRTDPARAARRAHGRLVRTLATLATATDAGQRRRLVRNWQRDAVLRLGVRHAAPAADLLGTAAWARLWDEAELHLYGRDTALPPDWHGRAVVALAEAGTPPPLAVRTVFVSRNLYPVSAALCLLMLASPAMLPAASPGAAAPRDWIAHYDRARADAVARRWTPAAVQAGIAWMQHPRSPATTALWTRAAVEAGFAGRAGGGLLLPDERRAWPARLLPPIAWELAGLGGAWLAMAGLAALLLIRFGHVGRRLFAPAVTAAAAGLTGAALGIVGVDGYGPAAASDAAIVWHQVPLRALPLDTPGDEARMVLAPGSTGHMDGAFLDWIHVTLADGQSGWLRRRDLLPLWRAAP